MHWTKYIIVKVIYQDCLMNLNYKDFPYHVTVIWNCWRNCLTVWSHGTFWGIIPNNIHRTIEIVNNQRMLTNDAHICVTARVRSLLSVIYQDWINSSGTDHKGNRSFTNFFMPCKCRVFTIGCVGSCYLCLWCLFHDSHQCKYLINQLVCRTLTFGPNLLIYRIGTPELSLLVECCSMVRRKCLSFILGIVHIFNSSYTAALTFLLSFYFLVRWLYPWNIHIRRRDLLSLIDECILQRDTSIIFSPEGRSNHDLSLDCVKPSYLDTLIQMSNLGSGINPHMHTLLDPFKDVVLILLYFYVAFKAEPLTFTILMRGEEEPLWLTRHDIYIIWSKEMVPQVTVRLTSIYCPLGWIEISPTV